MKMPAMLPWLLAVALSLPAEGPAAPRVAVTVFYLEGCAACADEQAFLRDLTGRLPQIEVRLLEAQRDAGNARLLTRASRLLGLEPTVLPVTFVGAAPPIVGFRGAASTGAVLEARVRRCLARGCDDPVAALLAGRDEEAARIPVDRAAPTEAAANVVDLPLLGATDVSRLPLVALAVVLGGLDSFNPCAFFVLFTLLGILVHARSRRRMLFVGGTFVAFSGLVYFLFMAAWLNLFLHVGELRAVTTAAGAVALAVAAVNVKDYFLFRRGFSLTIPEGRKPGLFERMRRLLHETSTAALVLGTLVLAVAANSYELLCTAGFPMVFTRILTLNRLAPAEHYLYLALYTLVYVIPLGAIVAVFSLTLGARKLTEEQGRILKLVSGLMMLGLGLVVLLDPALFGNVLTGVGLLGAASLAAGIVVAAEHAWRAGTGARNAGTPRGAAGGG